MMQPLVPDRNLKQACFGLLFAATVILSLFICLHGVTADEPVDNTISAAMQRFKGPNTENELYTRFRYSPVEGLGFDPVVGRRDPSTIIKVDDTYFVWYTHCTDPKYQWLNADIWYATSKDGYKWKEQGPAVERGPQGAWDDFSVFTCNILVPDGKYYLAYQAECMPDRKTYADDVVGMAWARSPRGPWTKLQEPILRPTKDAVLEGDMTGNRRKLCVIKDGSFDSKCVHDPGIVIFNGKYYLYYKGHGWTDRGPWNGTHPADTMWGVAIADKPTGPYTKSEYNPVTNSGHEVWVFPWKTGIAALVDFAGPEANTAQYSVESESIERALDTGWSNGADVRVDHGCLEIGVSE